MTTTPTKRQQILDQFNALLVDGEANIKHIEVNRPTVPDHEKNPFPSAYIYSGRARRMDDGVIGEETFEWEVMIALWVKGDDIEALLGRVESTLSSATGRSLNCVAEWSQLIDAEPLTVDAEKNLKSFLLTYEVRYAHAQGEA